MDRAITAAQIYRLPLLFGRTSITQTVRWARRALHRSLSIFLTAIVFFAAGGVGAQAPKDSACGIIYLLRANRVDAPPVDLAKEPCWSNPYVQGVLLRTHWNKIQAHDGPIDWSFFDQGVALAAQYHKKLGLLITAGVTTPEWVYAAGARRFTVNKLRNQGEPAPMHQPLPWDPVFQAKWSNVIRAFGGRYDRNPKVAYVIMGGSGRKAESFFVSTPEDIAGFERLGGLTSWKAGVKWITNEYAKHFIATPFLLDLGAPVPSPGGRAALADVCNYAVRTYPHRFGVKSDGLAANYDLTSFGAREVAALTGKTTVGFQMSVPSKHKTGQQGGLLLADALDRGIGLGAHFIEVYAVDCNDPLHAKALAQAADKLKKASQRSDAVGEKRQQKTD